MSASDRSTKPPPPGRLRMVREGALAGVAFALADALAAGPWRTPLAILFLILVTSVGGGLLVGLVAPRRRGFAAAVTLLFVAAGNGLATLSKDLGGASELARGTCLGLALVGAVTAALLLGFALRPRASRAVIPIAFAGVPGGTLVAGLLPLEPAVAFGLGASVAPLAAALGLALRGRSGTATLVAFAALGALVLPVRGEGDPRARHASSLPAVTDASAPAGAPDVVLLVVDTLRADATLDLVRRPPDVSAIGRLAQEGVRFEQAVSAAPWTLPSMASLLTGLYPSQHGAVSARRPLAADIPTLAERFHAAGYETAAFTGGGFVGSAFGIDRGFEHFDATADYRFRPFRVYTPLVWRVVKNRYAPQRWLLRRVREFGGAAEVRERVARWLERRDSSRPYFLFVHTYQVHDYYVYDPPTDDRVRAQRAAPSVLGERLTVHPSELEAADQATIDWFEALYDVRVRYVDRELAELLHELDVRSTDARPRVTVMTSDHGEGFDAETRRVHHGGRLHDDLLRVPLLLAAPGLPAGGTIDATVRTIDLMPTLLELAGLDVPDGLAGRSLVGPLRGAAPFPDVAFGEEFPAQRAARTADWKLIGGAGFEEAYDLRSDPGERMPDAEPPQALREAWSGFAERYPPRLVDEAEIDPETRAQLRALGYADED